MSEAVCLRGFGDLPVTPSAVCVSDLVGAVSEAVAAEESRQAGLTVARDLSLVSQNSRIHLGCLTHNSRIHSSHLASHARARSSAVSVTGDCCARFPRSFAAVVAADVAMPDACANGRTRGSRVDAFNSGSAGGLLPVCKSTSYHLEVCSQGPTGRKRVKGGVSGPAEDLRPCLRGGGRGKFSAGWRCTGAGCRFTSQEATRHRFSRQVHGRCGHTFPPPGIQFVSPGYGLDIRQSMGWTKVCGTTRSGIWVLKGNARTRMLPENLDYLRVGWRKQGEHTRPPGLRQGTTVCVHTSMDVEQQSDHKLMTPSGMGLLVCGAGSHPSCHPGVQGGMCQP